MPCTGLRFLVVEDEDFQRKALAQLLTTLGAEAVYSAENGQTALQVVWDCDRPIDIVVTDLDMPGMDGMEFIRHLGETGSDASLILTSAVEPGLLDAVANMARAYKVGLLGAVCKPPTAVKLRPLIEAHRSSRPQQRRQDNRFSLAEITQAWADDEFEPWFEPTVDLTTGAVRALSAVPRWHHPKLGTIDAPAFMGSIEARGLNDDFTWLMLRKSALQCRRWHTDGNELRVTVNLTFSALTDVNMASRIQQIARLEGLDPRFMVLTVSERALNTGQARALENLARLRVMGFGLGIDDFGSGPMAVEQLALVAFTEMKIQASLLTGAEGADSGRAGLAVALELASQLKLKAIAAGISSKHEWKLLYEWGCVLGQGSFISPPLKSDAVAFWLNRWRQQRG